MRPIHSRLRSLALTLPLLLALPSCEVMVTVGENQGVTKDGDLHDGGLALQWRGLDVWSDGATVHYSGQLQPAADSPSAMYALVLRIGNWSHCILSGIGSAQMQSVEGSVALENPAALGDRPCEVSLTGHLDTPANALEGKSKAIHANLGILRRTDPLPAAQ